MDKKISDVLKKESLNFGVFPLLEDITWSLIDEMREAFYLKAMENSTKEVYLIIDSEGGNGDAAHMTYDFLKALPMLTVGIVNGFCKSGALDILAGCKRRLSFPHSLFLMHSSTVEKKFNCAHS